MEKEHEEEDEVNGDDDDKNLEISCHDEDDDYSDISYVYDLKPKDRSSRDCVQSQRQPPQKKLYYHPPTFYSQLVPQVSSGVSVMIAATM